MGIDRRMASYKTYNSGTWDRITNLRLGVSELDDTVVPPGGTFSLNDAIGERTEERGFRSAPVIIGTEYEEEVGGGTSQVATTVFNAAWEAGLHITERNPHSLYISRYQLGRDATVYWPSLDLKFVNDTKSWILVKGFAESDGISVAIYGGEEPPRRELGGDDDRYRLSAGRTGEGPDPSASARPSSTRSDRPRAGPPSRATVYALRREADPRGDVEHVVQGRDARHQGRDEEAGAAEAAAEEEAAEGADASRGPGRYRAPDSAVATASASHAGTRVGR